MTAKPCAYYSEECGSPHESLDGKRFDAFIAFGWGVWPSVLRAPWRYRLHWDGFPDARERRLRRELYANAPKGTPYQRLMRRLDPILPFHVCERLRVCFNHWLGNYGLHPIRDPVDGKWYYVSAQRAYGRFYCVGMIVGDDCGPDGYVGRTERHDVLPPALLAQADSSEVSE